ncbi:MAG: phospholipid carrier-dependent glycosyltransferase [Novosphingobium sp.]|nr:phospholipid carrier-dependent glycosyltransferase [Novosphingobium sp.]
MRLDRWGVMLLLALVTGLSLRLHGIDFGLPALNDPDELMFELGAVRMLRSFTLNPGWFGHPATTTMYGLALVDVLAFASGYAMGVFRSIREFGEVIYCDPSWVILPGRMMIALFGVGCIWLTARLGRQLFDRPVGVMAAALLALSPVAVTWSQVIRSDIMASFFMLLCMSASVRIAREDQWRDHVWAALWLGLAVATKWPFALTGLAVAGAHGLVLAQRGGGSLRQMASEMPRTGVRLTLFCAMMLGFLILVSPYLVLAHETVWRNLQGEAQVRHLGATGGTGWNNAAWYLRGPIFAGMGPAGMVLATTGLPIIARRREALAILGTVAAAFFVLFCFQRLTWERWALPLLPLLSIVAAAALVAICRKAQVLAPRLAGPKGPALALAATALIVTAILLPLLLTALAGARERTHDTRQRAARWAIDHVPAESTVLIEHFAFDLYPQPWRILFPLGDVGCVDAKAMLHGKVGYGTIEAGRGARANVDYGTVDKAHRETCRADYAILTQYDRYRAERDAYPHEIVAYEELLQRGTIVASFAPQPGISGGPTVRIVRLLR